MVHDARGHNLPLQPTPLIGREREVAAARRMLLEEGVRLLTLTGAAGTGKTRLGVAVAAGLGGAFAHGAWFVDLAPVSDPTLVVPAIAQTLGMHDAGDAPLAEGVHRFLREKRVLLVLDNFEQVLAAAPQVAELLGACPGLVILATSRAALHLRWEYELAVPTLAVPSLRRLPPPDALAATEAVALFVQRARAVHHNFALDAANARVVAEVCVRLDGLPLALELAAARIRALPPGALLARLERRLQFLVGGARDQPTRHQTLRAAIAWSYDLLPEPERVLFRRLGAFVGGFTLAGAEAVGATPVTATPTSRVLTPGGRGELDVLAALETLIDSSLVRRVEAPSGAGSPDGGVEGPRYTMLETLREYALERLAASGEAQALFARHAEYFLALVGQAEPRLSAERHAWLALRDAEHDNLRAALARSLDPLPDSAFATSAEVGLRLAVSLGRYWGRRRHFGEGRRWLEAGLAAAPEAPAALRARALFEIGWLAHSQGDYHEAVDRYEASLVLYRELGDAQGVAHSLFLKGTAIGRATGDYSRRAALQAQALEQARELGDTWQTASFASILGRTLYDLGEVERAVALLEEGLALFRAAPGSPDTIGPLLSLSNIARARGEYDRAQALLEESDAVWHAIGEQTPNHSVLCSRGILAQAWGDLNGADVLFRESLDLVRDFGNSELIATSLFRIGAVAQQQGEHRRAARLFGAARARLDAAGLGATTVFRGYYEPDAADQAALLSDSPLADEWEVGRAMTVEQAIADALAPQVPAIVAPEAMLVGRTGGAVSHAAPGREARATTHAAGRSSQAHGLVEPLSERETQVLRLLAAGLTNPEIAGELTVSLATVKTHVLHVFGKLAVNERRAAARKARELQLI